VRLLPGELTVTTWQREDLPSIDSVAIDDVLEHRLSNARLEAAATKLRLLTRLALGSHKPLVALAMLRLGGLCPPLPARP